MKPLPKFYRKVDVKDADDCWYWQGNVMKNGYGQTSTKVFGTQLAHRISYMYWHGRIQPGNEIDHTCNSSDRFMQHRCVNPRHLDQVTPAENQFRRRGTHCRRGHEYAVVGTYTAYGPDGVVRSRRCKQCQCDSAKARYHAKKELAGATV